ncbi:DNA polymerase III subunit beta [Candidatus Fermentibacterales bacterium]|nr:DNA polymerase III subunit beta [Candidatus Fermentibacterales bacterium]
MIKLLVSQSDFLRGLNSVATALPPRTSLPSLTNILLEAEKDSLHLAATDLDTTVTTSIPATVTTAGAIALPGKKLHDIVKELPDEDVHLSGTGNRITISCASSSFVLSGTSKDSFPTLPGTGDTSVVSLPRERLAEAIRRTSYAVAMDDYRPALNGALWKLGPGGLEVVATDGHRLARIHAKDAKSDTEFEAIVAPKALNLLARLAGGDDVGIRFQGTQISFEYDHSVIYSRTIEGPYPPYEKVIPRDNDKILKLDRETLIAALRRMMIIANPATHQVRLSLEPGNVVIYAQNTDAGEAKEELAAEYSSEPLHIGFNGSFFLETLRNMATDDVIIRLKSGTTAAVLENAEPDASTDYLALLMPVKLPGTEV